MSRFTPPLFVAAPWPVLTSNLPPDLKELYLILLGRAWRNNYEYCDVSKRELTQWCHVSRLDTIRERLVRLEGAGWLSREVRPGRKLRLRLHCRYDPHTQTVLVPSAVSSSDSATLGSVDDVEPDADFWPDDTVTLHGQPCIPVGPCTPPVTRSVVVEDPIELEEKQQQSRSTREPYTVDRVGLNADELAAVAQLLAVEVSPRSACEALVRKWGPAHCSGWARWGAGKGHNSGGLVRARIEGGEPPPSLSRAELEDLVRSGRATQEQAEEYYLGGPRGHLILH